MSNRIDYIFDKFPRWIEYSGCPSLLNQKLGSLAWPVFKKLIELDCRYNPSGPGWYDVSQEELSNMLGISIKTISRDLKGLLKMGAIEYIPGKYMQAKGSIRINRIPIRKPPENLRAIHGGSLGKSGRPFKFRYDYERVTGCPALCDTSLDYLAQERVTSCPESPTPRLESPTGCPDKDTYKDTDYETDKESEKNVDKETLRTLLKNLDETI